MKKELSLKKQFKEATTYIKESSNYIFFVVAFFLFSILIGFVFRENLTFLDELLKEMFAKAADMNTFEITFFILQNNLQSSIMAMLIGIFLGIFPIMSTLMNGVVLGYVLGISYEIAGITSWWRLFPHGIFELPAIFISFGLGIKLGFTLFLNKKIRVREFKKRFYNSMNTLLMVIIPLLIIAAIIEGLLIGLLP